MKRFIEKQLIEWKNSSRRKPLIVRGGRQVGKTWSIEQFGQEHFDNYINIDLEKRSDLHSIFKGNLDPQTILPQLEVAVNKAIKAGNTLLFFDEIQTCPRALLSLKYFYEDFPDLHVISAGSLLEFGLKNISFPVGRIQLYNMFPMNFYEFLRATGKELLANELYKPVTSLPETIHKNLLSELKKYFFIGGMPECIKVYKESKSIIETFKVQNEIIETLKQDFSKYAPRADKTCLTMILENVAQQIGEQSKYSRLAEGYTNPTIHKNFNLLTLAKVINKIPATDPSGLPLGAGANPKKFKTTLLDIGLMQRLSHLSAEHEMKHSDLLNIYRGKLAEQFAAQELLIAQNSEIYYWAREARSSSAEVDFIIQQENKIIPVKVKSGKGGSLKSLHLMLEKYPNCNKGIVLYAGTLGELKNKNITFLPLYYTFKLTTSKSIYNNYLLS